VSIRSAHTGRGAGRARSHPGRRFAFEWFCVAESARRRRAAWTCTRSRRGCARTRTGHCASAPSQPPPTLPASSLTWMRSLHRCTRMACPRRLGARVGGARFAVGWPKMAMRGVRSLARLRLRKLQMAQMAPAMLGVPPPPRAPRRRLACQGGDCERHLPSACKPERAQDASTAHAKEEIASAISMLAPFSHSCRGRCTQSVDRFNHRRSGRTGRCARRACEMGTQLNTPGRHWVSSPTRRTWGRIHQIPHRNCPPHRTRKELQARLVLLRRAQPRSGCALSQRKGSHISYQRGRAHERDAPRAPEGSPPCARKPVAHPTTQHRARSCSRRREPSRKRSSKAPRPCARS